jgi:hypothetical protein
MTGTDETSLELKLARAAYAEAEKIKKAAEQDRVAAEYDRGQAEHRLRTAEATLRAAQERERWLEQHGEAEVRALVAAADDKLKQAQELMKDYNREKHSAAINFNRQIEREDAERAAAGIGN